MNGPATRIRNPPLTRTHFPLCRAFNWIEIFSFNSCSSRENRSPPIKTLIYYCDPQFVNPRP